MDNFDSEKFIIINGQNTDLKIIDSNTKLIIFDLKKNTDNTPARVCMLFPILSAISLMKSSLCHI